MKILHERILQDGRCLEGGILKVDSFINHQMDPNLMKQVAVEFIRRFADLPINKILTVEASGIAPSVLLGYLLELPVVYAKKKKPKTAKEMYAKKKKPSTMKEMYVTEVRSFTKQRDYTMVISKEYLTPKDHILFIDDFLAYGNTGWGIIDLCQQAGATIEGMGFIIEKAFQHGRELLTENGVYCIESLAIIDSLEDNRIQVRE